MSISASLNESPSEKEGKYPRPARTNREEQPQ